MMRKWMVVVMAALVGCAQIPDYEHAVKTPPPAGLAGYWQSQELQKGLVSDEAIASLLITPQGDTLDCRQWQQVIAKPGKVTRLGNEWVNVNNQLRVMPLTLDEGVLHYDSLTLHKVTQPTPECQAALVKVNSVSGDAVAAPKDPAAEKKKGKAHHRAMIKNQKS